MECYLRRSLSLTELALVFNGFDEPRVFLLFWVCFELFVWVLVDGLLRVETYVDDPRLGETL
jgi:hypothetical protein